MAIAHPTALYSLFEPPPRLATNDVGTVTHATAYLRIGDDLAIQIESRPAVVAATMSILVFVAYDGDGNELGEVARTFDVRMVTAVLSHAITEAQRLYPGHHVFRDSL